MITIILTNFGCLMNLNGTCRLLALACLALFVAGCQKAQTRRAQEQSEVSFTIPAPTTPAPVLVPMPPPIVVEKQPEVEPKMPPHPPRPKLPDVPPEKRTVAEWIKQLRHPDLAMKEQAINALVQLGEKSVPGLIKEVEKPADERSRVMAIKALGRIGPKARAAVPTLKKMLDDHDPDIRYTCEKALERIAPGT